MNTLNDAVCNCNPCACTNCTCGLEAAPDDRTGGCGTACRCVGACDCAQNREETA